MSGHISKMTASILILVSVIILVPIGMILFMTITDYRPPGMEKLVVHGNGKEILPGNDTLKIMTLNLGYSGLGKEMDFFYDGGEKVRPSEEFYNRYSTRAYDFLGDHGNLDFYFFQEIDRRSKRSYYHDQLVEIASVLSQYAYTYAINYKVRFVPMPLTHPMGKVSAGMATFSRARPQESERVAFISDASWPLGLFMLDRCFILNRYKLPSGKDLVMINTHNSAFDDGTRRTKQLAVMKNTMINEYGKGNYVVAGGDWNLNPVGFYPGSLSNGDLGKEIYPRIENNFLPDGWQWTFDPATPSNRAVDLPYRKGTTLTTVIDFFVVSPNIGIDTIHTVDLGFEWSDHQPVFMTFVLKK